MVDVLNNQFTKAPFLKQYTLVSEAARLPHARMFATDMSPREGPVRRIT